MFFHIQALAKAKDVPNQDAHSARRQILIEIRVAKRQMSKDLEVRGLDRLRANYQQ